jgi:hypothetical protein
VISCCEDDYSIFPASFPLTCQESRPAKLKWLKSRIVGSTEFHGISIPVTGNYTLRNIPGKISQLQNIEEFPSS